MDDLATQEAPTQTTGELMQAVVMQALANLMEAQSMPQDGSVASSGARLAVALIKEYIQTDSPISLGIGECVESLRNSKDEIVRGLGILNRQLVWGALSNLSRQKESYNASQSRAKEAKQESASQAEDNGPIAEES